MPQKLTERAIKGIEPPTHGAVTVWDAEVKGFGIRVFAPTARHPEGARSFFVNYRVDGNERRFTIGSPPSWSADAARAEAKELRKRIDRGEDPTAAKRDRRDAPTVKDLAERYRREYLPGKAAQSQRDDWNMIDKVILPRLGDRKVEDVHHGDIEVLHKGVAAKGSKGKPAPVRANRVLAVASKMFALSLLPVAGEDKPWRDQAQGNPCKGVRRNPEEGHERFLSAPELAALGDALAAYPVPSTADCVRLIMLTGCRPGEAMLAKWEQFEAEPGFWVKPSAHTKQRRIHRVPLSPPAIELLARVKANQKTNRRAHGSDYVFPGLNPGEPLKQLRTVWDTISGVASVALWGASTNSTISGLVAELERARGRRPLVNECMAAAAAAGIKLPPALTDARLYDLRHSFASIGAGGGLSLQIIGRLLGHTQARTTQRYAHLADDPLREATAKIGAVISGAGSASNPNNVTRISRRGS